MSEGLTAMDLHVAFVPRGEKPVKKDPLCLIPIDKLDRNEHYDLTVETGVDRLVYSYLNAYAILSHLPPFRIDMAYVSPSQRAGRKHGHS